jgi:hypothetical protein
MVMGSIKNTDIFRVGQRIIIRDGKRTLGRVEECPRKEKTPAYHCWIHKNFPHAPSLEAIFFDEDRAIDFILHHHE